MNLIKDEAVKTFETTDVNNNKFVVVFSKEKYGWGFKTNGGHYPEVELDKILKQLKKINEKL